MATLEANQLALAPLGAGDLIDRAVRLYRRHFTTLLRIAAPPVLISMLGRVMMTVGNRSGEVEAGAVLLVVFGALLWVGGLLLNLMVMGGAARNLITHLLWQEPMSARITYRNVRARFWGLLGAALLIGLCLLAVLLLTAILAYLMMLLLFIGVYLFAQVAVWLASLLGILGMVMVLLVSLAFFFFLWGRLAYVPQIMLIEGRGVFDAVGRSIKLARGNVRRLLAMTLFYNFATWSALMLFMIPLLWYGYLQGVNIAPQNAALWPTWYAIGYDVLTQASAILLAPVLMLGFSLLYIDERVRQEGYDVELMAARQLGEMPNFHTAPQAPYTPAIAAGGQAYAPAQYRSPGSTLGLS